MQNPTSCLSAWHWSRWSGTTGPLLMLVAFNVNMTSCLVVYNVTLWSSYTCALMGFESVLSKATQKQEMQVQMTQILNARASLCPLWRHKLTSTYWWRWVTLLHFQVTFASCRAAVLISLFTLYTLHPKSIICFTFSQSNQELLLFRVNTLYGGGNIRYMWVEKKKKEANSTHYYQRKHGKEPDPGISWWVSETTRGVQSWT